MKNFLSNLKQLQTINHVKEEKKKDVVHLMKFFTVTDEYTKIFYDTVCGNLNICDSVSDVEYNEDSDPEGCEL